MGKVLVKILGVLGAPEVNGLRFYFYMNERESVGRNGI